MPSELAVLPSLLSLPEIAEGRALSLNTVKFHLRSVYRKIEGARSSRGGGARPAHQPAPEAMSAGRAGRTEDPALIPGR
jgi:DNA-binding NarL/FixJ family response regulator